MPLINEQLPSKQYFKRYGVFIVAIPFFGYYLGHLLDMTETNRMTRFRDKSALYGREMKPGEPPSWP